MISIETYSRPVALLCQRLGVKRLGVFGSALRADFAPGSDVDVVALFDRQPGQMFTRYFDLKEGLEQIFGRPVDVVVEDAITNPYFRQSVEQNNVVLYGI